MGILSKVRALNYRLLFRLLQSLIFTIAGAHATVPTAWAQTVTAADMRVTKTIDRPVVASGETVKFRLEVTNSSGTDLSNVKLEDSMPPGFTYAGGSAKIQITPRPGAAASDPRSISPGTGSEGVFSFSVGKLTPGGRATISFAMVVGPKAIAGEFQSKVVGSAALPSGERVSAAPVQVKVMVLKSTFALTQVLVGRVFEDVDKNGKFDSGEPGVPNVRVVTSTGQTAITDQYGQYNLPALAAGSVLIALDRATLPSGLELPQGESGSGGAGRLLRKALDGGGLLRQNFGLVRTEQQLNASKELRFESEARPPMLLAAGEVGIGLSNPAKDSRRVDGQASLFYQDSITSKDLLTVAVRTRDGINDATGTPGMFASDPAQRAYPMMGDGSTGQELAQSGSSIYARYDRGRSYFLYGDLRGDSPRDSRNSLLEFNRNVTGMRAEIQGAERNTWAQGQFARPRTAHTREVVTALSGSAIRLSRAQIVRGSETITLELRDRRSPETIISRETLIRNVDYTLDVLSGVLYLTRPISLFDRSLNIVQIVTTYEYETAGLDSFVYLARGSHSFERAGLRLGGSFLNQNESGANFAVGGLEAEQKLFKGGKIKAAVPVSNGHLPTDLDYASNTANGQCCELSRSRNGKAVRTELEQPLGFRNTVLRARYAKTDDNFFNPYGSIVVTGQQTSAASVDTRPFESTKLSLTVQKEDNRNDAVDNERRTISAKLSQTLLPSLTADAGIDRRAFEDHRESRQIDSHLLSAGLQWNPLARLETTVRREENIGDADPTYPNQTLLGMQFRVTPTNRVFATQRLSNAPIIPISGAGSGGLFSPTSMNETAIGMESRVSQNTSLTGRYRLDSSIDSSDSFAVLGMLSRVPVRPGLAVDWSVDDALHLAGNNTGYVGAAVGLSLSEAERIRSSIRYELRRQERSKQLFSAGIVGRLTNATAALARYRISELAPGSSNRISDGQLAISTRPRESDRVAFLLSYDYASTRPGTTVSDTTPYGRTDRLSADGLMELTRSLEFYSRVAVTTVPGQLGDRRNGTLLQSRLQQGLSNRFDIAGEARWKRAKLSETGAVILASELGTWITPEVRLGLGYSSRSLANAGPLMNGGADRGGAYLVISSRLSSIFDLMGGPAKAAAKPDSAR